MITGEGETTPGGRWPSAVVMVERILRPRRSITSTFALRHVSGFTVGSGFVVGSSSTLVANVGRKLNTAPADGIPVNGGNATVRVESMLGASGFPYNQIFWYML